MKANTSREGIQTGQKRKYQSITVRILAITAGALFMTTGVVYLLLYFFLPQFYENYKIDSLEKTVNQLEERASSMTYVEGLSYMAEVTDISSGQRIGIKIFDPTTRESKSFGSSSPLTNEMIDKLSNDGGTLIFPNMENAPYVYSVKKDIHFSDRDVIGIFDVEMHPVNEVSEVLFQFIPYVASFILLISTVTAIIYSRMLVKPIVSLNKVAREMGKLDFTVKADVRTDDEIGELGETLNTLSSNLQNTMAELEEANEALKDDIQRERKKEEARRTFISIMSHELKSPITAIRGQIEGMIYNIGAYKNRDKYLRRSLNLVEELDELVRETLASSKLDDPDFVYEQEAVNVSDQIYELMPSFEHLIKEQETKINLSIEPNMVVEGDHALLKKVFKNIIENGIKYGKEVDIKLYKNVREDIVFRVFNTGNPIPEEDLQNDRIFNAFYRGEKSRNRETGGSGLGLYIVKRILDIHRYSFKLENVAGGVAFTIYLRGV